jgi:hypothetical protein
MPETHFNRSSWIALGASIGLILTILFVNLYRYSLPTDGWVLEEDAGLTVNILGLPSALQPGDMPVSLEGLPFEGNRGTRPDNWEAGSTVQYSVLRAGQSTTIPVSLGNWNLVALEQSILTNWSNNLIGLLYFLIGAFVFLRRPGNLAAQVLLFLGTVRLSMDLIFIVPPSLADGIYPFALTAVALLGYFIWGLLLFPTLLLLSLVFPKPKQPFRTHPLLTLLALYLLEPVMIVIIGGPMAKAGPFIGFGLVAVYGFLTVISIIHTLITERHDPLARAQIRWVGLGVALVAGYQFLINVIGFITSNFTTPWWLNIVDALVYLALPVTIGIAILRYRLWDIDLIIRKTLQYTLLTGLLVLVYFSSVVLLQSLFETFTGQRSPVVIVFSTLAIAALFNPLRTRIQAFIDRRFFRQKYDSERTLAHFAMVARDEVDLDRLTSELLAVVANTMQSESVSLWLKQSNKGVFYE